MRGRLDLPGILLALAALGAAPLAAPAQEPDTTAADSTTGPRDRSLSLELEMPDTLELTLSEGTWISLDVTPDGESVIFELLGDIWRVPIEGGVAEPLLTGPAFDSQPRVSPDGAWVAFISDRDGHDNLWIARPDGSEPKKLTSERQRSNSMASPTWTPDAKYVIATRRGPRGGLRMYHVDGGSGVSLNGAPPSGGSGSTPSSSPSRLGAAVSLDGKFLYFAQSGSGGGGQITNWQIGRRHMVTGEVDVITQADGRAFRPTLSPDGTLLVYATRFETETGLRVRDLESGADRWLIHPVQRDEVESGGSPARDLMPSLAFVPDGSAVLTTFGGRIQRVDLETGEASEVPFTADVKLALGPDLNRPYRVEQGPVRARLVQGPRQSPDGGRVVFSVLTKLYAMDLPDGEPERLTDSEAWEFKPTWSPDGEWIAYVTWDMDGGHIWKIRSDGSGQPIRLTEHQAFYTDLSFSPDGSRIVGLRGNAYQRQQTFSEFGGLRIQLDLVWLDARGGDVHLIAPARGLGAPHFAGDSERVYVYSRAGLISMRYDGTDRRTHLKVTGPSVGNPTPPPASAVLLRPDGAWALAAVNNQLHVVAVPPVGGDGATVSVRSASVPTQRITDIGADYFAWADGGETITWAIGSTFFRRPFSSLEFERKGPADEEDETAEEGSAAAAPDSAAATDSTTAGDEEEPKDPLDLDESVEVFPITLEFERATPDGTFAFTNATLITMAREEVIEGGDIVVTDNRITALGPAGSVEIPSGAEVIDASGKFIVPGFIDTHAHWEFRTHDVLEPQNWSLVANLAYGVTAGLDVQTSTNDYFAYQDLVETGQSVGQRAFMTGPGIFANNDFQSYEAVLSYLRRYKEHYRTPNIKSYMVGTRKQRQWVVRAANELDLMPTTEGGRDQKLDMTHAIDGFHGNEHTLPIFPFYDDVVQLFARTKTAYTPTLLVQYGAPGALNYFMAREEIHDDEKLNRFYPHNRLDVMSRRRGGWHRDDEYGFAEAAAQAAKIQRAGGLIGVGGHGELQGLGYHWEMWALAAGGMNSREVLRAATIDGARIIGFAEDLGSLEVGKLADMVVLDRDPLEDIRNTNSVRWVMKNGEVYEGDTLTRLWPSRQELRPFWWWEGS
jgi:imidazolonepropionase-like amidohydrolase/Tol biopolymer transport system component